MTGVPKSVRFPLIGFMVNDQMSFVCALQVTMKLIVGWPKIASGSWPVEMLFVLTGKIAPEPEVSKAPMKMLLSPELATYNRLGRLLFVSEEGAGTGAEPGP